MTEQLDRLIASVEAGALTGDANMPAYPAGMAQMIDTALGLQDIWQDVALAHDGSLNDAADLHDTLLPGWSRELCDYWVRLRKGEAMGFAYADCRSMARAWLLAILRAYKETLA